MTAEELVIGHFDRSLTSEQEAELAGMVDSSPEVRALFEQHKTIDRLMVGEAEVIAPSKKLDKVALAAALGAAAEIGGQAVGISFAGKIAAVVSGLAVGGLAIFVISTTAPDPNPVPPPAKDPAASTPSAPVTPTPEPAAVTAPETSTTLPEAGADPSVGPTTSVNSTPPRPSGAPGSRTAASANRGGDTRPAPTLKIPKGNPVLIQNDPSFQKQPQR